MGHSPAVSEDREERTGREVELPRRLGWRGGVATGNRKPGAGRHGGGMEILCRERGRSLWRRELKARPPCDGHIDASGGPSEMGPSLALISTGNCGLSLSVRVMGEAL